MTDIRGSLLPSEKELKYFRKQFVQSAKLQGRIGKLYQVREFKVNGTDQDYDYEKPVEVAYHINTNPSRKYLTKYGWQVEDNEELPIIVILTYYDLKNNKVNIDEGAILEISGKHTIEENDIITERFKITEMRTDLEMNQAVCKVTPDRLEQIENVKVMKTKEDPNLDNVYIRRKIVYEEGPEHENINTISNVETSD